MIEAYRPVLMTPQGNQEIHRYQHQLPEKIEKEEVQSEKDAYYACNRRRQVEMEKPHSLLYLRPRSQHGRQAQEDGEKDEQEAQPVHGQVKADPQGWNPGPLDFSNPRTRDRVQVALPAPPQAGKQCQVSGQGDQGYPACKLGCPARLRPRLQAPPQRG